MIPSKLKILMITSRTDLGGGPKHLVDLMRGLNSNQELELFLASPLTPPFGEELKHLAIDHFVIPHRGFRFINFIGLYFWARKHKIVLVHSHGRGAGLYSRLLFLLNFKIIHTFHGVHKSETFIGRAKFFLDQFLRPFADGYICVSSDEKEEAIRAGILHLNQKSEVILNGINLEDFKNISSKPLSSVTVIGMMARFDFQKGLDIFLEYLRKFIKDGPKLEFKLKIAGFNREELILDDDLKQKVEVVGKIFPASEFLATIDAYLSTSRWEGMPLSVIEAMACKKPCMLSKVPGHEYFINEKVALGFDLNSYQDFKEKFIMLIQLNEELTSLGLKGNQFVLEHHSHLKMAKSTQAFYKKMLNFS